MKIIRLFGAISKVEPQDDGTIKVWGVASSEAVDGDGEVIKADAMRKALPDYMEYGNIREMHGKVAAGVAFEANVDDDGKTNIGAHIVDPVSVKKVQTGVLKGFSIGGSITGRDKAEKTIVTGIELTEISLVDRPCNPDARVQLWKADKTGPSDEQVDQFVALTKLMLDSGFTMEQFAEKVAARADVSPKAGKEKYGDVKFADEKNKKYPIDTPAHIKAAWNYIHKEKNAAKYSSGDLSTIKSHIVAAWKDKIDKAGPPSAEKMAEPKFVRMFDCEARAGLLIDNPKAASVLKMLAAAAGDKLEKGMWTVQRLAELVGNLFDIQCCVASEAAYEGDHSILPDELKDSCKTLAEVLMHMVAEEVEEMFPEDLEEGDDVDVVALAATIETLAKRGAKHSAATIGHLQGMHDTLKKMTDGKVCATEKAAHGDALAKLTTERDALAEKAKGVAELTKALETAKADAETLKKSLVEAQAELEKAAAEIERLKKEPMPGGPIRAGLHVVTKVDDAKEPEAAKEEGDGKPLVTVITGVHNPEEAQKAVRAVMAGGGRPMYKPHE